MVQRLLLCTFCTIFLHFRKLTFSWLIDKNSVYPYNKSLVSEFFVFCHWHNWLVIGLRVIQFRGNQSPDYSQNSTPLSPIAIIYHIIIIIEDSSKYDPPMKLAILDLQQGVFVALCPVACLFSLSRDSDNWMQMSLWAKKPSSSLACIDLSRLAPGPSILRWFLSNRSCR